MLSFIVLRRLWCYFKDAQQAKDADVNQEVILPRLVGGK